MDGSSTELVGPVIGGSVPASALSFEELGARAAAFARNSRAPATDRAYRSGWRDFEGWCCRAGLTTLPATPATIGAYLADRADYLKVSSLARRVAAIAVVHRLAGYRLDRSHPAIAACARRDPPALWIAPRSEGPTTHSPQASA